MDLNNYRVNDDRMAVPLRGNRSSRNSTQVFFKSYPTFLKVPIGLVIRSKLCKKNNRDEVVKAGASLILMINLLHQG